MSSAVKYVVFLTTCLTLFMASNILASDEKLPKKYTETITTKTGDKISFEMVLIPAGEFLMGSPKAEPGRKDDEGPQHQVRLDPFYLCTTETTLELFLAYYEETVQQKRDDFSEDTAVDAMTGPTPVYGDLTMGHGHKYPALGMSWLNAMNVGKWLSEKTGKKYRLPTEAEWEYACRAGANNVFGFGSDPKQLENHAWYEDNSEIELHEVAKKKPNAWGLYDMLGNVCEWVYDFYSPTAYTEPAKANPAVNPKGPKQGKVHVARGGTWDSPADKLRCASRAFEEEYWRSMDPQMPKSIWWLPDMDFIGFRVARSVDRKEKK